MQGKRNDIDSATCDSTVDPQRYWNSMRGPSEEQLSDCVILSSNANIGYQNSGLQEEYGSNGWNLGESSLSGAHGHVNLNDSYQNSQPREEIVLSGWSLGESSSIGAHNQVDQNDPMSECTQSASILGSLRYLSSEIPSLDNINENQHAEHVASGRLFVQSSIPQNLTNVELAGRDDDEDDDCQVIECVDSFKLGSSFQQCGGSSSSSHPFDTSSGIGGFIVEDTDERPSSSLDSSRLSCKRKTLEASAGQSSQSGSSSHLHHTESRSSQGMTLRHNTASGVPVPTENILNDNLSEQSHPRLGLRVGGPASDVPLTLSSSGTEESSLRDFRLRINNSYQQDCIPGVDSSTQENHENANMTSVQRMLRLPPISNSLNVGPFTMSDDSSHQWPTIATLRRNSQSSCHRASGSGTGSSVISGERAVMQEEHNSGSSPTDISHPMLIPASSIANSFQTTGNWGAGSGNVASSSGVGSSSGVNSPAPSLALLHNSTHYPRRPSEFNRRSLIPLPGAETGTQDLALSSGSSSHGHRRLHSRSAALLLERHLGSTFGIPYSSRSSTASGEGRSRMVSEIRNVLDMMRRGEGLRAEDVMILDQSVFFGMANIHDRHRDMRLDVDNMSYEELLALGDRIGNVSTGLSDETISSRLKQRKYICISSEEDIEAAEPCSICQEAYKDGEDLGLLDCGHDYHTECIKKWLIHKNSCPICKTTGLNK